MLLAQFLSLDHWILPAEIVTQRIETRNILQIYNPDPGRRGEEWVVTSGKCWCLYPGNRLASIDVGPSPLLPLPCSRLITSNCIWLNSDRPSVFLPPSSHTINPKYLLILIFFIKCNLMTCDSQEREKGVTADCLARGKWNVRGVKLNYWSRDDQMTT